MALKIGYARVSTKYQDLSLQIDALVRAGVDERNIYTDKFSGAKEERPGLKEVNDILKEGDTLVVWRLDRLGRSVQHLIRFTEELTKRRIMFHSLQENIDTNSASGKLILHVFASLCEFERNLISERTKASILSRTERGLPIGRKRALTPTQEDLAVEFRKKGWTKAKIARELKCSPQTIRRALEKKESELLIKERCDA